MIDLIIVPKELCVICFTSYAVDDEKLTCYILLHKPLSLRWADCADYGIVTRMIRGEEVFIFASDHEMTVKEKNNLNYAALPWHGVISMPYDTELVDDIISRVPAEWAETLRMEKEIYEYSGAMRY